MTDLQADSESRQDEKRAISDSELMNIAQEDLFEFTHSRRKYTILEDLKNDINKRFNSHSPKESVSVVMITRGELRTLIFFIRCGYDDFKFQYIDEIRDYLRVSNVTGVGIHLFELLASDAKAIKVVDSYYSIYVPLKINAPTSYKNAIQYNTVFLEKFLENMKTNKINPITSLFLEAEKNSADFKHEYIEQKKYLETLENLYQEIYGK